MKSSQTVPCEFVAAFVIFRCLMGIQPQNYIIAVWVCNISAIEMMKMLTLITYTLCRHQER